MFGYKHELTRPDVVDELASKANNVNSQSVILYSIVYGLYKV